MAPYHFAHPYYTFRPHVSLGFGLAVGYPVRYPYFYGYPYAYSYPVPYPAYPYPAPYAYPPPPAAYPPATYPPPAAYPPPTATYPSNGYPAPNAPGSVNVQPGATNQGGVSFEITPNDADVYVDGLNVGRVSDFGPTTEPLSMAPGRHHIEIRRAGYHTMTIEADVRVGEVVPYAGTMQPQ